MTLNELLDKYRKMDSAKRRFLLIMPAAIFFFALMTAPRSQSAARILPAAVASDCAVTKLHMSILGRSLVVYEWQSGICPDPRKR
jgi:hypothetical protein